MRRSTADRKANEKLKEYGVPVLIKLGLIGLIVGAAIWIGDSDVLDSPILGGILRVVLSLFFGLFLVMMIWMVIIIFGGALLLILSALVPGLHERLERPGANNLAIACTFASPSGLPNRFKRLIQMPNK
jgi:hypothetical protein